VADIMASREWLVQQPWAARDRISLIGWANGASALLWAVRPQLPSRNIEPDFRSAIAFYPNCRISSGLGWSARVPTLLLIGAKDDVSSPPACRQMVDGAQGRSALARIVVYPSAYHDFDRANFPLHAIGGGSDAALPEKGHVGTDAEARADSQKRVAEWLAR
jgi:dienelactone hydrolase